MRNPSESHVNELQLIQTVHISENKKLLKSAVVSSSDDKSAVVFTGNCLCKCWDLQVSNSNKGGGA